MPHILFTRGAVGPACVDVQVGVELRLLTGFFRFWVHLLSLWAGSPSKVDRNFYLRRRAAEDTEGDKTEPLMIE